MCGIVGMIAKNPIKNFNMAHKTMFKQLLHVDTLRGKDSTGIFVVNKFGNVNWAKEATSAPEFMEKSAFDKTLQDSCLNGMFMVGHNRSATRGMVTDNNAHPFVEENIIMVHNGTINNQKKLHKTAEVDSHAICHAMVEHGVKETLSMIDGAYAIAAYDTEKKTLFLSRNKERPLWIGEDDDTIVFASEPWMIFGISWRNNLKYKLQELSVQKMLSFKISSTTTEISLAEEEIAEYVRPFTVRGAEEEDWWNYYKKTEENEKKPVVIEKPVDKPALTSIPNIIVKATEVSNKIRALFPKANVKWDNDDIINFCPTGYEKMENGYRIVGHHYQYPEVKVIATDNNMSETEVIALTSQDILMADIVTIVQNSNGGRITLYCAGPCCSSSYVSVNGTIITEEMTLQIDSCKDCASIITEDDIENSVIKLDENNAIKHAWCPTCSATNLITNPAWCNLNEATKDIILQKAE